MISDIKSESTKALIADTTPSYVEDWKYIFTTDNPQLREAPAVVDSEEESDTSDEPYGIAQLYDLFTIVLKKKAAQEESVTVVNNTDNKVNNNSANVSTGGASAVKSPNASSGSVAAAKTGDKGSALPWVVAGAAAAAIAGTTIAIRRKRD